MDFAQLIKKHGLLDIITVGDEHYALTATTPAPSVPGCTALPASQLPLKLAEFLRHGYSQRHRRRYGDLVGIQPWIAFSYGLTELAASRKQVFSHALSGTGGRPGLLQRWHGQKLGRSAFLVPSEYEAEATAFLSHWAVPYTAEVLLREN